MLDRVIRAAAATLMAGWLAWPLAVPAQEVPPLDCKPNAVCREPKTFLPARVLTRPFSNVYKEKNAQPSSVLAENVTAYTPLYIYAREEVDFNDPRDIKGWYQVGETAAGKPLGWMQAKDVMEWRQALIVAFTPPGVGEQARKPVIMFDGKEPLSKLLDAADSERSAQAEKLYQVIEAARAKKADAPDEIVSIEPGPFIDIKEKFYILPVLQFEDLGTRFADESRLLQLTAATGSRAGAGEPELPTTTAGLSDASATGGGLLDAASVADLNVEIVFVMDMTASMGPFIKSATQAVSDIARFITRDPDVAKSVRFGFIGYRDDIRSMPYLEFTTRDFTEKELVDVDSFVQRVMAEVNANMDQFIALQKGSGDYAEEVYAGMQSAAKARWGQRSVRFVVLVGDASAHEPGHPQSTTGLDAPSTRQLLNTENINVIALHLKDQRASPDHAMATSQLTTLATNPSLDKPSYYSVNAADTASYAQAVKDIATVLTDLTQNLKKGDIKALVAKGGGTASTSTGSGAAAGTSSLKADVAKLGLAAVLPYLGKSQTPPRDMTFWAFDRDMLDPKKAALEVRVLLTKEQVNDLVFAADTVVKAFKRAELTNMQFFDAMQSVTTLGAKGQEIDYKQVQRLQGSGIAAEWIESLPYKSQILSLNNDTYANLSSDDKARIENGLQAKLELYQELIQNNDIWVKPSDRSPDEDKVYPLELNSLP